MSDLYKGAKCRSCQAEIIWCLSEKGKRMPIDAHPQPGANVRLVPGPADQIPRIIIAKVIGPAISLFDDTDDGTRHYPHHMTCPQADEWKHSGEPKDTSTPGPRKYRTMRR